MERNTALQSITRNIKFPTSTNPISKNRRPTTISNLPLPPPPPGQEIQILFARTLEQVIPASLTAKYAPECELDEATPAFHTIRFSNTLCLLQSLWIIKTNQPFPDKTSSYCLGETTPFPVNNLEIYARLRTPKQLPVFKKLPLDFVDQATIGYQLHSSFKPLLCDQIVCVGLYSKLTVVVAGEPKIFKWGDIESINLLNFCNYIPDPSLDLSITPTAQFEVKKFSSMPQTNFGNCVVDLLQSGNPFQLDPFIWNVQIKDADTCMHCIKKIKDGICMDVPPYPNFAYFLAESIQPSKLFDLPYFNQSPIQKSIQSLKPKFIQAPPSPFAELSSVEQCIAVMKDDSPEISWKKRCHAVDTLIHFCQYSNHMKVFYNEGYTAQLEELVKQNKRWSHFYYRRRLAMLWRCVRLYQCIIKFKNITASLLKDETFEESGDKISDSDHSPHCVENNQEKLKWLYTLRKLNEDIWQHCLPRQAASCCREVNRYTLWEMDQNTEISDFNIIEPNLLVFPEYVQEYLCEGSTMQCLVIFLSLIETNQADSTKYSAVDVMAINAIFTFFLTILRIADGIRWIHSSFDLSSLLLKKLRVVGARYLFLSGYTLKDISELITPKQWLASSFYRESQSCDLSNACGPLSASLASFSFDNSLIQLSMDFSTLSVEEEVLSSTGWMVVHLAAWIEASFVVQSLYDSLLNSGDNLNLQILQDLYAVSIRPISSDFVTICALNYVTQSQLLNLFKNIILSVSMANSTPSFEDWVATWLLYNLLEHIVRTDSTGWAACTSGSTLAWCIGILASLIRASSSDTGFPCVLYPEFVSHSGSMNLNPLFIFGIPNLRERILSWNESLKLLFPEATPNVDNLESFENFPLALNVLEACRFVESPFNLKTYSSFRKGDTEKKTGHNTLFTLFETQFSSESQEQGNTIDGPAIFHQDAISFENCVASSSNYELSAFPYEALKILKYYLSCFPDMLFFETPNHSNYTGDVTCVDQNDVCKESDSFSNEEIFFLSHNSSRSQSSSKKFKFDFINQICSGIGVYLLKDGMQRLLHVLQRSISALQPDLGILVGMEYETVQGEFWASWLGCRRSALPALESVLSVIYGLLFALLRLNNNVLAQGFRNEHLIDLLFICTARLLGQSDWIGPNTPQRFVEEFKRPASIMLTRKCLVWTCRIFHIWFQFFPDSQGHVIKKLLMTTDELACYREAGMLLVSACHSFETILPLSRHSFRLQQSNRPPPICSTPGSTDEICLSALIRPLNEISQYPLASAVQPECVYLCCDIDLRTFSEFHGSLSNRLVSVSANTCMQNTLCFLKPLENIVSAHCVPSHRRITKLGLLTMGQENSAVSFSVEDSEEETERDELQTWEYIEDCIRSTEDSSLLRGFNEGVPNADTSFIRSIQKQLLKSELISLDEISSFIGHVIKSAHSSCASTHIIAVHTAAMLADQKLPIYSLLFQHMDQLLDEAVKIIENPSWDNEDESNQNAALQFDVKYQSLFGSIFRLYKFCGHLVNCQARLHGVSLMQMQRLLSLPCDRLLHVSHRLLSIARLGLPQSIIRCAINNSMEIVKMYQTLLAKSQYFVERGELHSENFPTLLELIRSVAREVSNICNLSFVSVDTVNYALDFLLQVCQCPTTGLTCLLDMPNYSLEALNRTITQKNPTQQKSIAASANSVIRVGGYVARAVIEISDQLTTITESENELDKWLKTVRKLIDLCGITADSLDQPMTVLLAMVYEKPPALGWTFNEEHVVDADDTDIYHDLDFGLPIQSDHYADATQEMQKLDPCGAFLPQLHETLTTAVAKLHALKSDLPLNAKIASIGARVALILHGLENLRFKIDSLPKAAHPLLIPSQRFFEYPSQCSMQFTLDRSSLVYWDGVRHGDICFENLTRKASLSPNLLPHSACQLLPDFGSKLIMDLLCMIGELERDPDWRKNGQLTSLSCVNTEEAMSKTNEKSDSVPWLSDPLNMQKPRDLAGIHQQNKEALVGASSKSTSFVRSKAPSSFGNRQKPEARVVNPNFDPFRSRKGASSRAPSKHVDDYEAAVQASTRNQNATNKNNMRQEKAIDSTSLSTSASEPVYGERSATLNTLPICSANSNIPQFDADQKSDLNFTISATKQSRPLPVVYSNQNSSLAVPVLSRDHSATTDIVQNVEKVKMFDSTLKTSNFDDVFELSKNDPNNSATQSTPNANINIEKESTYSASLFDSSMPSSHTQFTPSSSLPVSQTFSDQAVNDNLIELQYKPEWTAYINDGQREHIDLDYLKNPNLIKDPRIKRRIRMLLDQHPTIKTHIEKMGHYH